jgi:ADP-heptose:LPS heptosyltransferase
VKVLAVRLARFGDIVLLLPALGLLKDAFPGCRLTFLTDERWKPLAEMCPAIDEVLGVDRIGMRDGPALAALARMVRLAGEIRRRRFDLVVDFHGFRETNLLTWLSGAPQRLGLKRFDQSFLKFCFNLPPVVEDKSLHVSEVFLQLGRRLGSASVSARPVLVVPETARQWARTNLPGARVVLFLGAPVPERIWPCERFAALADRLAEEPGLSVVAVAGAGQAEQARRFLSLAKSADRIRALSGLSIPQLAATVESAQLLVSNDTGPMHLGPALGVPTLGLFSVGIPAHFRPAGERDRFLQRNPIVDIGVEEVVAAVEQIRVSARSGLPH